MAPQSPCPSAPLRSLQFHHTFSPMLAVFPHPSPCTSSSHNPNSACHMPFVMQVHGCRIFTAREAAKRERLMALPPTLLRPGLVFCCLRCVAVTQAAKASLGGCGEAAGQAEGLWWSGGTTKSVWGHFLRAVASQQPPEAGGVWWVIWWAMLLWSMEHGGGQ